MQKMLAAGFGSSPGTPNGIASMDLFVVPTISFRLLYGFLVLQHSRREILWLGVTEHPTAQWIAHQLSEAYGWQTGAAIYRSRPGLCLWRCLYPSRSRDGHPGSADRTATTMAKWPYGKADRLDTTGLP